MERVLLEYMVNSAWQVPLLAAAAWLGVRVGRGSAQFQHGVWIAALAAAVLLPAVPVRHAGGVAGGPAATSGALLSEDFAAGPTGEMAVAEGVWAEPGVESRAAVVHDAAHAVPERVSGWRPPLVATRVVVDLYLIVIAVGFMRIVQSWYAGRRILRDSEPAELGASDAARLSRCCEGLGLEAPEIRRSAQAWSPVVIGVLRPVVLLPKAFECGAEAEEREAVWWHELVHVRRRDYLLNLVCRVSALPILYHPAAHLILRRVRLTRELVCDAIAAEKMSSRVAYARCLVELADRAGGVPAAGVEGTAMFGNGALEERVMELLGTKQKASAGVRVLRAGVSAALFAAVVSAAVFFHVTPTLAQTRMGEVQPVVASAQVVQPVPVVVAKAVVEPRRVLAVAAPEAVQEDAAAPGQGPRALSSEERERLDKEIAEAQRSVDDALKQLNNGELQKNVDEAIRSLNTGEMQKQISEALKQAKNLNSAEMQKKIADAMAHAQAQINSPEFRKRMEELNSPEFRKRMDEAAERAKHGAEMAGKSAEMQKHMAEMQAHMAEMQKQLQEKLDSPEWKKQMEELNSPEFRRRMEEMQKQLQDEMKALREHEDKGSQASPEMRKDPKFQQQYEKESSSLQARMLRTDFDYRAAMNLARPMEIAKLQAVPAIDPGESGAPAAAVKGASDEELYEGGISALTKGDYQVARLRLQTLVNTYPQSRYVADAKRAIAQSWDAEGTLALVHAEEEYQAAGVGAKKLGSGITPPMLVSQVNPDYTPEAKAAKVKGTVLVNVWVDEQGNVQHVRVVRGLGSGLDEKAIDAVRQYKFKPAMETGKPVMVALNVEVNFQLF